MPDLVVENLAVRLGGIEILKKVSFTAVPGEIIALLGPSGSGKTTLLRCVAGLERPYQGKITIGERTLLDAERGIELAAEQRGLGLVFQSYALWPHKTVFENVAYALRLRRGSATEIDRRVNGSPGSPRPGPSRAALSPPTLWRPTAARRDRPRLRLRAARHPARRAALEPRCETARRGPCLVADADPRPRSRGALRDPRPGRGHGARRPRPPAQRRRCRARRAPQGPLYRPAHAVRRGIHGHQQPPGRHDRRLGRSPRQAED